MSRTLLQNKRLCGNIKVPKYNCRSGLIGCSNSNRTSSTHLFLSARSTLSQRPALQHCFAQRRTLTKTMANNIPEAFQNGTLYSDKETYKFLKFPTSQASSLLQSLLSIINKSNANNNGGQHFQAFMIDKDEISVMLSWEQFQQFQLMHNNSNDDNGSNNESMVYEVESLSYRLITFDVVLAPTLVGFMAVVTRDLADAHISVLPFAAYSRDHIFVSQQDYDTALTVLQNLKTKTTTTTTTTTTTRTM
jgi:hypothetical protein